MALTEKIDHLLERVETLITKIDQKGFVDQIKEMVKAISEMQEFLIKGQSECNCQQEFKALENLIMFQNQQIKDIIKNLQVSGEKKKLFPLGLEKPYPQGIIRERKSSDPSYWHDFPVPQNKGKEKLPIKDQN